MSSDERLSQLFADPAELRQQLRQQLLECVEQSIDAALVAANDARDSAAHKDNQPENQYDTLSLEAAYLAHGQSERIQQLQQQHSQISHWPLTHLSNVDEDDIQIGLGRLVKTQSVVQSQTSKWIWLAPIGGYQLSIEGIDVLVISPTAPLAKRLIGLFVDDEFDWQNQVFLVNRVI